MKSYVTDDFIEIFKTLPKSTQLQARKVYKRWQSNPRHPSLQFKQIHPTEPLWSVRIGLKWRALGLIEEKSIYWFWIGNHNDYEKFISQY